MIIVNGEQYNKENIYDVLFDSVYENDTIEDLYNSELNLQSDNNLEIMCIYEKIVVQFVNEHMLRTLS